MRPSNWRHQQTDEMHECCDTPIFRNKILEVEKNGVVAIGITLATDESSANRTKKWNHVENVVLFISNLPKTMQQTHFVATLHSKRIDNIDNSKAWAEIFDIICKDLFKYAERGMQIYDAHLQREITVTMKVLACLCDNPRAENLCANVGTSGNYFCRFVTLERDASV
jgi:hypothetical protein